MCVSEFVGVGEGVSARERWSAYDILSIEEEGGELLLDAVILFGQVHLCVRERETLCERESL